MARVSTEMRSQATLLQRQGERVWTTTLPFWPWSTCALLDDGSEVAFVGDSAFREEETCVRVVGKHGETRLSLNLAQIAGAAHLATSFPGPMLAACWLGRDGRSVWLEVKDSDISSVAPGRLVRATVPGGVLQECAPDEAVRQLETEWPAVPEGLLDYLSEAHLKVAVPLLLRSLRQPHLDLLLRLQIADTLRDLGDRAWSSILPQTVSLGAVTARYDEHPALVASVLSAYGEAGAQALEARMIDDPVAQLWLARMPSARLPLMSGARHGALARRRAAILTLAKAPGVADDFFLGLSSSDVPDVASAAREALLFRGAPGARALARERLTAKAPAHPDFATIAFYQKVRDPDALPVLVERFAAEPTFWHAVLVYQTGVDFGLDVQRWRRWVQAGPPSDLPAAEVAAGDPGGAVRLVREGRVEAAEAFLRGTLRLLWKERNGFSRLSPDGMTLYKKTHFFSNQGERIDLANGTREAIADVVAAPGYPPTDVWLADPPPWVKRVLTEARLDGRAVALTRDGELAAALVDSGGWRSLVLASESGVRLQVPTEVRADFFKAGSGRFSDDGKRLLIHFAIEPSALYDVATGHLLQRWPSTARARMNGAGRVVALTPDGLSCWDGKPISVPPELREARAVALGSDGMVVASTAHGAMLWDPDRGSLRRFPHFPIVRALEYDAEASLVAATSEDGSLATLNLDSGAQRSGVAEGSTDQIQIAAGGSRVVVGDGNGCKVFATVADPAAYLGKGDPMLATELWTGLRLTDDNRIEHLTTSEYQARLETWLKSTGTAWTAR